MDVGGGKKFRSLCPFHFFLLHFLLGYSALSLSAADAANSKLGSGHAVDSQKLSRCSEHFSPFFFFFLSLYFMATLTAFGNCPLFNAPTPPTPLARTFFHGRRKHRPSIFADIKPEIGLLVGATLSFAITKVVARRRRVDRP